MEWEWVAAECPEWVSLECNKKSGVNPPLFSSQISHLRSQKKARSESSGLFLFKAVNRKGSKVSQSKSKLGKRTVHVKASRAVSRKDAKKSGH